MVERKRKVRIQWTTTAKETLKRLPRKVQAGLIEKAEELGNVSNPRDAHKPLVGPLGGFYRITYGRYRAVYGVREENLPGGDVLTTVTVTFIACGKREEYNRDDVYRVAQKAVELGLIRADESESPPQKPPPKRQRRPRR